MKKKNFVTLIMSVIGGILFALGMCMALLPEWDAMTPGIVVGGQVSCFVIGDGFNSFKIRLALYPLLP